MLAEIFMLRLEATMRTSSQETLPVSTSRFVPFSPGGLIEKRNLTQPAANAAVEKGTR